MGVEGVSVNHVGLCVADLDRSRRFYEGLGFTFERAITPPDNLTAPLLGLTEPVGLTAAYLTCGTFTLELLHYEHGRAAHGAEAGTKRVMNEPGLTHLSLTVDDLAAARQAVTELGGEVLDATDIGLAVMVRDPDGQLLELLPAK